MESVFAAKYHRYGILAFVYNVSLLVKDAPYFDVFQLCIKNYSNRIVCDCFFLYLRALFNTKTLDIPC